MARTSSERLTSSTSRKSSALILATSAPLRGVFTTKPSSSSFLIGRLKSFAICSTLKLSILSESNIVTLFTCLGL